MSLIKDWLIFNSANECPQNYHIWSMLNVLSAVLGRKVHISQGKDSYFKYFANIYPILIGEQGGGKTTAKDLALDVMLEAFPVGSPSAIPVGASVTTPQAICKYLALEESNHIYLDEHKTPIECRPLAFFVNELKNFLTNNPSGMINFLTDVYDSKLYINETKNKGTDVIVHPYVTFLACETPEWIINNLKQSIITGGFSRRIIPIYELESGLIPRPKVTADLREAKVRVVEHLKRIKKLTGKFEWTEGAEKWWDTWYIKNRQTLPTDDPIIRGFRKTMHVQLLKICMLLAACEYEEQPKLLLTENLLEMGLAMIMSLMVNMPKLSVASGRNELAGPMQKIIQMLEDNGGIMPEKLVQRNMDKELAPSEQFSIFNHLVNTERIIKKIITLPDAQVARSFYLLKKTYDKMKKDGTIKD